MSIDSRYILASKLARFLRKNGDKVINGSCKLSLTTSALCLLNSLFQDILQTDLHYEVDSSDSAILCRIQEDVQYLYHFMKKTSSLKLFHGMQTLRGGVDLSHFSSLTVLELRKIPAHLIIGLSSLSVQLKAFICSRSICLLKELFSSPDDEQSNSNLWIELKELNLSYNYLENLDDSIKNLPNVEILNLSHNRLKNTDEIKVLKQLNFVNLSYNQLETLPQFNCLSCRFLNKLNVRNNNLERLDGLECLFNLEEFDVGYNLLSEYSTLSPLNKLKSLQLLNLEGNPLYFHKKHLEYVCTFLHPYVLNRGLHLNGKFIAIPQNLIPTTSDADETNSRHQTSINTVVGDLQNAHPPQIKSHLLKGLSSLESISTNKRCEDENGASAYVSQIDFEHAMTKTAPGIKDSQMSKKVREVLISDPEDINSGNNFLTTDKNIEVPSHIKVKQVFERRRKNHGESWLIPDDSFQKSFVSSPKVPSNTPIFNNVESIHNDLSQKLQTCLDSQINKNVSMSPLKNELIEVLNIKDENVSDSESERKRHISRESDDIEVLSSNLQDSPNNGNMELLSSDDLSDSDIYKNSNVRYNEVISDGLETESEEESEDCIFFVEKINNLEKKLVSVNIGARYAKEKDTLSGKLLEKLDLNTLASVSISTLVKDEFKRHQVHLKFDSVKTSKQQRLYILEDLKSAQKMAKILQPFADACTLKKATIGALECLNCKSQFSKEVADRKVLKTKKPFMGKEVLSSSFDSSKGYIQETDACPNCGNHILVEMESIPLPSVATPPRFVENKFNSLKKSENSLDNVAVDSSSGNLFTNLLNSIKISPMLKRKPAPVPFNDNLVDNYLESGNTFDVSDGGKESSNNRVPDSPIRRNSSDITIISNPSQSSIAVIPEPDIENNLNTIIERDSQLSLSPSISRGSTILSNNGEFVNKNLGDPTNDQDFYSLTESLEEKPEKSMHYSDILSNDSDIYHSPFKSVTSLREEMDESEELMQLLGDKKSLTPDFFKHLDHRLKLHVEINIFGTDEHLTACLQTSIVPLSTGEEFEGLFVLSSKNIYIIKFLPLYIQALEQSESLGKQVQVLYSGPANQLKQIQTLLGNQGMIIACGPVSHVYTLIIRDADICNSLFDLISEQAYHINPQFECLRCNTLMMQHLLDLIMKNNETPKILLHQFAFQRDGDVIQPICITLTQDDMFLTKILFQKQQSCTDISSLMPCHYVSCSHQKISDVVSLKLKESLICVELCFNIESSEVDTVLWTLEMSTKSAMFSFINALKGPWEELFAVTLNISMSKNSA